jgi:hypothetical protein
MVSAAVIDTQMTCQSIRSASPLFKNSRCRRCCSRHDAVK